MVHHTNTNPIFTRIILGIVIIVTTLGIGAFYFGDNQKSLLTQIAPTGTISASPSPCIIPSGQFQCSATITWKSTGATDPCVYLRETGQLFSCFGAGGPHSAVASWITKTGWTFDLHSARSFSSPVITSVKVVGVTGTAGGTGLIQGITLNKSTSAGLSARLTNNGIFKTTTLPNYSYFFTGVAAGYQTVSVTVPTGYSGAEYNVCYNNTTCHGTATWRPATSATVSVPQGGYVDLWWRFVPMAAILVDTALTCNTEWGAMLPTTDSWRANGTNISARVGVNRNFGGIGVELTLSDPNEPTKAVNIIESRSGAGAGWQTSYWVNESLSNRQIVINQAAGNSIGSQWGVHNSFLGMVESRWNPLNSDQYSTFGIKNSAVGTSPCNKTGYTFDNGKLALNFLYRRTSAGTAVLIRNQYTLQARISQSFKEWALEQAFYLSKQVAFDNNLRVYFHGRSGWNEGPIIPWTNFSILHGTGSCDNKKCEYAVNSDVAYGVLVWKIGGQDIGVVIPANTAGGVILLMEKSTYCEDSTNLTCGNISYHNYLDVRHNGYQVSAGAERTYRVTYTIGTVDQLRALGYQF